MRPYRPLMLCLGALLACTSGTETDPVDTDPTASDSDTDTVDPEEIPEPLTDAEIDEVAAALEDLAQWVPRLGAAPVIKAANDIRQLEELPCPSANEDASGMRFWTADCETDEGARFLGAFGVRSTQFEPDLAAMRAVVLDAWGPHVTSAWSESLFDAPVLSGVQVRSAVWVDKPDGGHVGVNGNFLFFDADLGVARGVRRKLGGPVDNSEPLGGDEDWSILEFNGELAIDELIGDTDDHFVRWISGSASNLQADYSTVNVIGGFVMGAALEGACTQEPSGTWSVRRPDGSWVQVGFDGPRELGEDIGAACDGCGTVRDRGFEIGKVCPDMSALWVPAEEGGS